MEPPEIERRAPAEVNRAYVEKLALDIEKAVSAIHSHTLKPYEEMSEAEKHAVRYNLIVAAEAVADLATHIARRLYSEEPETPIHAITILRDRGLLAESEYHSLASLIRLRSTLILGYSAADSEEPPGDRYRYRQLGPEEKSRIKRAIRETLEERGIDLAVLFGSFIELPSFRDIDIAVHARGGLDLERVLKLAAELEARLRVPVDVVPFEHVSVKFRHHVLTRGEVILEKEAGIYEALLMQTLDELAPLNAEAAASGE